MTTESKLIKQLENIKTGLLHEEHEYLNESRKKLRYKLTKAISLAKKLEQEEFSSFVKIVSARDIAFSILECADRGEIDDIRDYAIELLETIDEEVV